jgi:hypothetical protein
MGNSTGHAIIVSVATVQSCSSHLMVIFLASLSLSVSVSLISYVKSVVSIMLLFGVVVYWIDSIRFWIDSIGIGFILSGFGSILTVLDCPVLDRFYRYWIDAIRFSIDSIGIGLILSGFGSILCIRIYSIRFWIDSMHSDRFYRFRTDSIGFGSILRIRTDSIGFGSILCIRTDSIDFGSILSVSARFYRFRLDSIGFGSILFIRTDSIGFRLDSMHSNRFYRGLVLIQQLRLEHHNRKCCTHCTAAERATS